MRQAICLEPTGNFQDLMKFMCMETNLKIVWRNDTKLSMPELVIKKVSKFVEREWAKIGVMFRKRLKRKHWLQKWGIQSYDWCKCRNWKWDISSYHSRISWDAHRENEMGNIKDQKFDENSNLETAEAKNCDLIEVPMVIGRETE